MEHVEKLPRSGWPVNPSVGECLNDNCWRRAQLTVGCAIHRQVVRNYTRKSAEYKLAQVLASKVGILTNVEE